MVVNNHSKKSGGNLPVHTCNKKKTAKRKKNSITKAKMKKTAKLKSKVKPNGKTDP